MAMSEGAVGRLDIMAGVRQAYRWAPRAAVRAWAPMGASAVAVILTQRLVGGWSLLFAVSLLAALAWFYGALNRIAFEDEAEMVRPKPAGWAWGAPETASGGAILLFLLLFILLVIAGAFASLLVGAVIYAVLAGAQGLAAVRMWTVGLVVTAVLLVFGWLAVRLCLSLSASAREQGVRVFTTWPLTRGRVLPLLAGLILVGAPQLIVQAIVFAAAGFGAPTAAMVAMRTLSALVLTLVQIPLTVGFTAWAYRNLRPAAA